MAAVRLTVHRDGCPEGCGGAEKKTGNTLWKVRMDRAVARDIGAINNAN